MGATNQESKPASKTEIRITESGLEAYVYISPVIGEEYTIEELKRALAEKKVVFGIKEDILESMVQNKTFFIEELIAEGIEAQQGIDGYFEYLFETNVDIKPKILKDGSADYRSMGEIPTVEEGAELVRYIPATKGKDGVTVTGDTIVGINGKELQALNGKGFVLSEDKRLYTAAITGQPTLLNNKLIISNVFTVEGDVTIATGDLNFSGDIIIRGNVLTGSKVKALGNITVDGHVEAAQLIAGRDIILKNGMQGGGKGSLEAGKDVCGKFFEQVTIYAKGNVSANAIMNCTIVSEESIIVSGKLGVIVGGSVSALRRIEATLIGNMAEVKTCIKVGTEGDLYAKLTVIEEQLKVISTELEKYKIGVQKIEMILQKQDDTKFREKKMQIMRLKIEKEAEMTELIKEKSKLLNIMEKVTDSKITINKSIYAGVQMSINGVQQCLKTENYNVTYRKKGVDIEFIQNI